MTRTLVPMRSGPRISSTIGGVVHGAMAVVRPLANVVGVDLDDPTIAGPAHDALVERTREDSGKEREDVELHNGVVYRGPGFRHEPRLRPAAASAGPPGSGVLPRPAC